MCPSTFFFPCHFSPPLDFLSLIQSFPYNLYNPLTQLYPPPFFFSSSNLSHHSYNIAHPDHTRKIELIRYLVSGYVNGKVLDSLSEQANSLASSALASLEDEADQLSHFPFLPAASDPVLTVPKHHGWYSVVANETGI